MRERLRRHVRFEVAGDGNQDMARVIEALPKETGSKQAAQPTSLAPSPDPTSGPEIRPNLCKLDLQSEAEGGPLSSRR